MIRPTTALLVAFSLMGAMDASAHLTYSSRIFDPITGLAPQTLSITGAPTATKLYGWADGTDTDWAKQDDQKYFKLTLQSPTTITITVAAVTAGFLPAFTLYTGLGHWDTNTAVPDYDGAPITQTYLQSFGTNPVKKGAFDALHNFKIGNDAGAELIEFGYVGNAADGTSANYGSAAGINGDGVADGTVTRSFTLPAGAYTLAVGGASINAPIATTNDYQSTVTVTSVPEPSTALLVASGLAAAGALRRRRAVAQVTV